ncbi:MAG TPA: hypothetical protein VF608_09580 [Thermoanaerobaculia bacterium]
MSQPEKSFEQFIAESFDSEEAVMIVLVLRDSDVSLSAAHVAERLERDFGVAPEQSPRLGEKRVELRLRDLAARGLVDILADGYRYRGDEAGVDAHVAHASELLTARRSDLNRLIYSTSARARRLAEAFRL